MADSTPTRQWESRPWLARSVRAAVFIAPILAAIAATLIVGRLIPRPSGLALAAVWWVGLTALSTVVLWLSDRVVRRLLPIAALFRLSLVFPDRAPSRFKTALRAGTVRQLQRQMANGRQLTTTPQEAAEQLVALASALNDHDRLTRGHTERVRAYSVMIGEELGLEEDELELLNWSGLVHDIGKLAVPSEILNKPGKPNDEEWAILRDHPARADELVAPLRPWLGQWAESATQHHERFDGGGYPNGLGGLDITLAGRIVAVADAYDVMTSARSYKKPMPAEDARRELVANAGTQFDPTVVRAFLNIALGRLRLVVGPLTSLLQFPAGGASLGSTAATGAAAVASVGVAAIAGLSGPAIPTPFEAGPEPVIQAAPGAEPEVVSQPRTEPEVEVEAQDQDEVQDEDGADPDPEPDLTSFRVAEVEDSTVDLQEDDIARVDLASLATGDIGSIGVVTGPDRGSVELDGQILTFTPQSDWSGEDEVVFRVCFVDWGCQTGTVHFVIGPSNDPPTPSIDRASTAEDTPLTVDVLANDIDIDGDDLELSGATVLVDPDQDLGPDDVDVSVVAGGILVEPGTDRLGSVAIAYDVTDGVATSTSRLVVEITPVNDAPVAVDDDVVAFENTTVDFDVLANDTDVDGDDLTIASVSAVVGGSAVTDGNLVTFVPDVRYTGPASLTYTVSDGQFTDRATVDIEIRAISGRPALSADTASGLEDQPITIDVLANDDATPASFDPASMVVVNQPGNGALTWSGSVFQYQPAADWSGSDSFRYAVCDTDQFCNTADVAITVSAVNDQPGFAVAGDVSVVEDSGVTVVPGWVSSVAAGPADEAGQSVVLGVTVDDPSLFVSGPAVDGASGDLSFELAGDANGAAVVTVVATDDGGTASGGVDTSAAASQTITVSAVNDAPVATDDGATVAEDTVAGVTFGVLGNDTDIDGDTLTLSSADTSTVVEGTITDHLDGTFTYVPDEHFNGTEAFSYVVTDGNGGFDTGQVTITITAVADAPVATDDARVTPVDAPLVVVAPGLLTNDYDADDDTLTVNTTPVTPPSNGGVVLNADGSYTYTPSGGFVGTDSFVYEISDPGGSTSTATVTITVDSGVASQTYFLGDSGANAWNFDLVVSPPASSIPVFDVDGDGDPGLTINKEKDEAETDPAKYQLWTLPAATPLALDGPVTLDLWSSIKDFETGKNGHPYIWLYDCLGASCTTLAQTDVHTKDWNVGDVADFTERVIDLGSVTHTVAAGRELVLRLQWDHEDMWVAMTADYPSALGLTLANVAPTASDDVVTVDEDSGTTNLVVLGNDVDSDLDPTSVTVTVAATAGTAVSVGDGTIDYTPDPDANGVDTFTYQVCDLGGNCDTAVVTVPVNAVNDQPTFTGGLASITGGIGPNTMPAWATAIAAGPADESGQVLTFVVASNDNPGIFSAGPAIDVGTGDMTFTTTSSGTANITVELVDDGGTALGGNDTSLTYSFTIVVP